MAVKRESESPFSKFQKAFSKSAEAIKETGSKVNDTKNTIVRDAKNKINQTITPEQMQQVLSSCYDNALTGIPKVSKSVEDLAAEYLEKTNSPEQAANALINNQIMKCTTSGFLNGLGGIITLPVTLPANVTSVLYIQMRMIAAVAVIGGYDVSSDQVQSLVYACLTGSAISDVLKATGIQLGNKVAISAIKKLSFETIKTINKKVGFRLITKFGQTGIINLGKMVPVVGGVIGGGFDFVSTKLIANNACKLFIGSQYKEDQAVSHFGKVNEAILSKVRKDWNNEQS
jgi:hypothetical protein